MSEYPEHDKLDNRKKEVECVHKFLDMLWGKRNLSSWFNDPKALDKLQIKDENGWLGTFIEWGKMHLRESQECHFNSFAIIQKYIGIDSDKFNKESLAMINVIAVSQAS